MMLSTYGVKKIKKTTDKNVDFDDKGEYTKYPRNFTVELVKLIILLPSKIEFFIYTDSSNLEIFLEMMNDKEIIIAVAHDDASKK